MVSTFETLLAVPLDCEACVTEVTSSLTRLEGVSKVEADLKKQLVSVQGTVAPSAIAAAIQATGRDAVLRGSGSSNAHQGAAVCILETHALNVRDPVRGLARIVQLHEQMTLIDLTVKGLAPGDYGVTVRECGDISRGTASTGGIWGSSTGTLPEKEQPKGLIGRVQVDQDGRGGVFLECSFQVWEILGRSMVLSRSLGGTTPEDNPNTLVGVIARSAGVWENDKTVCSCSGKTLWEEREENVVRGML